MEGNASDAQAAREVAAKYPNVKNAHIVPRTYLENFADDGKIGVVLVPELRKLVQAVSNVGTRRPSTAANDPRTRRRSTTSSGR